MRSRSYSRNKPKDKKEKSVSEVKIYEIGGKKYVQKTLVIGQVRQLQGLLDGITIPSDCDIAGVVKALGDNIYLALAIVLTLEGESPRGKDLSTLAGEIEWSITPEQTFEVVDDFFGCNPVASILQKLAGVVGKIQGLLMEVKIGSTESSASSLEEISPVEMTSFGDVPLPNADHILNTADGS
jgi:hypothetical protein